MQLYNSLSRKKDFFEPLKDNTVNIYVCGITAYDYCHIGHARSALTFDILVRYLRFKGFIVNFIRNFTDIDDKIIIRANKEKRDWRELTDYFIQAFHEDMDSLGILRADLEPRATAHIEQMQIICQKLIAKNHAYATKSGDVYFRVRSFPEYGKLSKRSLDDLIAGARIAIGEEKEDPLDFALWKSSKEGEPFWESPWGKGRPGWHIECSAMNEEFLPLDIHGGGLDLAFPHHENEIAQSEAATGKQLARFWVHNGFVQVNSEKMSKSLGNFKTIRQILEYYLPESLRFFLLGKHYRSPIDFTDSSMDEAEKGLKRIYECLLQLDTVLKKEQWKEHSLPQEIRAEFNKLTENIIKSMEDDCNSAQAIGHLFNMVHLANRIIENKKLNSSQETKLILNDIKNSLQKWGEVLGLFTQDPQQFLHDLREKSAFRKKVDTALIDELIVARQEARNNKNFALSDEIRDKLITMGIELKDTTQGTSWDII